MNHCTEADCLHCKVSNEITQFMVRNPSYPPDEVLSDLVSIMGCIIVEAYKESGDVNSVKEISEELTARLVSFRQQAALIELPTNVKPN